MEPLTKKSHTRLSSLFRRKTAVEERQEPATIIEEAWAPVRVRSPPPIQAPVLQYPAYIAQYQMNSQPQSPQSPQSLVAGPGHYRPYPEPAKAHFAPPGSLVSQIPEREQEAKMNLEKGLGIHCPPSPAKTPRDVGMSSPVAEAGPSTSSSFKSPPGGDVTPTSPSAASAISTIPQSARPSMVSTIDSPTKQRYEYWPIETGSIRLVRILPGRRTTIECEVIQAPLDNAPQYVAVSYTWGDVGDTKKIDIEGSRVPITVSLYGALQALRQKQSSVLVWADALCIDQSNTDERSQQVQLMPQIYSNAAFVAIWLGPEENDSLRAVGLLEKLSLPTDHFVTGADVSEILADAAANGDLLATVSLFGRPYWKRLWATQEVFNAKRIAVHCGDTFLPWQAYKTASHYFRRHHAELDFKAKGPDKRRPDHFTCVQTLIHEGPACIPTLKPQILRGENALLEVLRASRSQLSSDPRDKLYGILGVLPTHIRDGLRVDYDLSTKDVYTEIVEFLIQTTDSLDVICESMHFPPNNRSPNLPSFVPDWSYIPLTSAMGHRYNFQASGATKAICNFHGERMNKLEISGIPIDIIQTKGMVVGTLVNLGDFLMAFLHWRALLLHVTEGRTSFQIQMAEECLAATICLGQLPTGYDRERWQKTCYHVIANLFQERLPYIPLDAILQAHLKITTDIRPEARRNFLQTNIGDRMLGRTFCLTQNKRLGVGSGAMLPGDVVVVPLGCSTPVVLRPEGTQGEFRYIGDVYIESYMYGKAIEQWQTGLRPLKKYVLH